MDMLKQEKAPIDQGTSYDPIQMAIAVLMNRVRSLSKQDQEDLYSLVKELSNVQSMEDYNSIGNAMREILDQRDATIKPLAFAPSGQEDESANSWISFVGEKIRMFRTEAGLTQEELSEKSGLPQSHVSRLETGLHSPSRATLEKIANALGRPLSDFDPSA